MSIVAESLDFGVEDLRMLAILWLEIHYDGTFFIPALLDTTENARCVGRKFERRGFRRCH